MKKIFCLLTTVALFLSCSSKNELSIIIENPTDFDRLTELVEISLDSLKGKVSLKDSAVYVVKNSNGEIIPSQVTYDRKLIFHPELKANESKSFVVTIDTIQSYVTKTFGRLIPERKDDFAWENDRVAFRVYGPALVEIDGPSNGLDIWYKRTNGIIIDKWYQNDLAGKGSYHEDHGEGLDDYKVGHSLGAGAMAPFVSNKLILNDNFIKDELLDNGPLRTTVKLTYKDMNIDGQTVSESRIFSIDAGSQLTKVIQAYGVKEPMQVAAGFVKREKSDSIIAVVDKGYLVIAEPKTDKVEGVYLGLVFPKGISDITSDTYDYLNPVTKKSGTYSHILAITTQQPKIPVIYYTGYGWAKFGFPTIADFEKYINTFAESLKKPLIIKYK